MRFFALAAALVLLFAGCGRRMPVAPRLERGAPLALAPSDPLPGVHPAPLSYRRSLVVWWSASGGDESEVESEHELTRVDSLEGGSVCRVPTGTDPAEIARNLVADGRVQSAEPIYFGETAESRGRSWAFDDGTNDAAGTADQTAFVRIGLADALAVSRGAGVIVAVIDTGVDPQHPLLESHLVSGYDFVDSDADPTEAPEGVDTDGDGLQDEALGHGSHVTGIVALVAPDAHIMPLRALDTNGRGDALTIARAVDYAVDHGARVINLSLGMLVEDELVDRALSRATQAGAVVVASAGNWGAEHPEEFPATSSDAFAVAATTADDRPTSFTSFGGFVAICAPGEGIRSAYWNGHTAVWSGTSMSAPFMAGGAALLLALHPGWTRADVMTRLAAYATPMPPDVPEATEDFGAGILNLGQALAVEPTPAAGSFPKPEDPRLHSTRLTAGRSRP